MHKVSKILLLFFISSTSLQAQNKYAVIVGINDYYIQPGVKHGSSLHGCVNDANAIKELLINRFGFNEGNIEAIYNEKATKRNVLNAIHQVAQKCNSGDAFIFFYSGHGAWMSNLMNETDPVKKGMSQALVMSDLYSPALDCLLTDEMLKKAFNEFVDKQVIATTLFDCCYSGNIAMGFTTEYWQPLIFFERPATKGLMLASIPYTHKLEKPIGCAVDSLGKIIDTSDSDHDGVPDCMDWEMNSPPFIPVDSNGISKSDMTAEDFMTLSAQYATEHSANDSLAVTAKMRTKSFDLAAALSVWYPLLEKRPSDRPNSRFLSIAAATDREMGDETTDENGTTHGAFTTAILSIYKRNSADIRVSDLLKKIPELVVEQGHYQHPTAHYEASRLNENLLGIAPSDFSNTIKANCTSVKGNVVTIDKGLIGGVTRGNVFKDVQSNKQITIVQAFNDSATAIDKSGTIKKNHQLLRTDAYTATDPIIKVFIPTINCNYQSFQNFFNSRIRHFVDQDNYEDFNFKNDAAGKDVKIFYDDKKSDGISLLGLNQSAGVNTVIFLPVPSYLANPLKSSILKDQNIQLVNKIEDADYLLYMNYTKERPGKPSSYIFYYHPNIQEPKKYGTSVYTRDNVSTPAINATAEGLKDLSKQLYSLTKRAIRYKTANWINEDPKK